MSKEQKTRIKENNEKIEEPYKFCVINGAQQKVGNYKIEPPGIFLGRGDHPKLGMIKVRVRPEDVTINLDKTAPVPKPNVPGKWKKVIHDNKVIPFLNGLSIFDDYFFGRPKIGGIIK